MAVFEAGQTVNTPLTPNSNAVSSATGDTNDDTTISFYYNKEIPYWSPMVSSSFTSASLSKDMGNAVVTFKEGLTVDYLPQAGGMYTVTVTGEIDDGGTIYNLKGKSIGTFPQKEVPK